MNYVVCKGTDIQLATVEEEIHVNQDIILVPIHTLVCQNCGERYYDPKAMRTLEGIRSKLKEKRVTLEEVGKVQRAILA